MPSTPPTVRLVRRAACDGGASRLRRSRGPGGVEPERGASGPAFWQPLGRASSTSSQPLIGGRATAARRAGRRDGRAGVGVGEQPRSLRSQARVERHRDRAERSRRGGGGERGAAGRNNDAISGPRPGPDPRAVRSVSAQSSRRVTAGRGDERELVGPPSIDGASTSTPHCPSPPGAPDAGAAAPAAPADQPVVDAVELWRPSACSPERVNAPPRRGTAVPTPARPSARRLGAGRLGRIDPSPPRSPR